VSKSSLSHQLFFPADLELPVEIKELQLDVPLIILEQQKRRPKKLN